MAADAERQPAPASRQAWRQEDLAAVIAGLDLPPGSWTLHSLRADTHERLGAQPEPAHPYLAFDAPLTYLLGRAQDTGRHREADPDADLTGYALVHQGVRPHSTALSFWAADLTGRMWRGHRGADGVPHATELSAADRDPYVRAVAALALATAGHFPTLTDHAAEPPVALLLGGDAPTLANATAFASAAGLQLRHYLTGDTPSPADWMDAAVALVDLDAVPVAAALPLRPATILLVPAGSNADLTDPTTQRAAELLLAEASVSHADQPDAPGWTTLTSLLHTETES